MKRIPIEEAAPDAAANGVKGWIDVYELDTVHPTEAEYREAAEAFAAWLDANWDTISQDVPRYLA